MTIIFSQVTQSENLADGSTWLLLQQGRPELNETRRHAPQGTTAPG